jgi:alpha-tubulin suppressor-like RCC1 family protein
MKKFYQLAFVIALLFALTFKVNAQIGIGTNTPHQSAIVDVHSSSKGFLPPRMSENAIESINNPVAGLMVYCTDCCNDEGDIQMYDGVEWKGLRSTCDISIAKGLKGSTLVINNGGTGYLSLGTDGDLYAFGTFSSALGLGSTSLNITRKPTKVPNPDNKKFIQVTIGLHGGAIALTSDGMIYGSGRPAGGSGTTSEVHNFQHIPLGSNGAKALRITTSEGGSLCMADDGNTYIWGYSGTFAGFGSWSNSTPVARALPTGVNQDDVVAVGASWHCIYLATKTKVYYMGSNGVFSPGIVANWGTVSTTFSNIKQFKVSRNLVFVEDDNGYHIAHGANTSTGLSPITFSGISGDIVDIEVARGDLLTVLTTTNLYVYSINSSSVISATRTYSIPSGYSARKLLTSKISHSTVLVLLNNDNTNSQEVFGANNESSNQTTDYGLFYHSGHNSGVLTDAGLDLTGVPSGQSLLW